MDADGTVTARWRLPAAGLPEGAVFATELSLFRPLELRASDGAETWTYPIETVAKSERGLDRTVQGEAVVVRWPASLGTAELVLR